MAAVFDPTLVGVNATRTVQVPPAGTLPQLVIRENRAASVPPRATSLIESVADPVLLTRIVFSSLVEFIA